MTIFDPLHYPYPSQRNAVYAQHGMVATSQPLAAQAGLDILKKGGNAVDAAIATAACLTVVEPTSNGIGGDAFALVWMKDELHGLNANGPAPQSISVEAVQAAGHQQMPTYGWTPVTVPGTPAAWNELSRRFGSLPLTEVLAPAIHYAEHGFPISPTLGYYWELTFKRFKETLQDEAYQGWFDTFAPDGRAPRIGELWRSPGHAATLRSIAESGAASFYTGELAEQMDAHSRQYGGYLRKEDLAAFQPEWVKPISVEYNGYEVWEIPPAGQGLIALMALNILKGYSFTERDTVQTHHRQWEAMKLAFTDGLKYITQEDKMTVLAADLLSESYAQERRSLIGEEALQPEPGKPSAGGTVYLATADNEGNMVSYIQSNYMGFGSGIVIPGTGISMQNRGHSFSLDAAHDNRLEPGKKTYHTIIPGFLTRHGRAVGPFGVMGGFMQPQGHVQVVMNMIDFELNPQAALDAPRWQWLEGKTIEVEPSFPDHLAQSLMRKGHIIRRANSSGGFGRGQIIIRDEQNGVLIGGTESRTDGAIAAW
ncbi:gamma-glutamyltransferase family protein [Paenibacillus hunanensis]|uniref:Gamma-glutamyltranspeptidase/glutathione hydrolase n=1 Tax=Paenibacillus hunanensis TaxID=539262 RepID=A0ABU1IXE8_9BACL|nr:gamma-glutamyltransferase family protein [Paenibacillus hunanensis]MDR6243665.1 gamma-glutamyltranspeptidase/glutathione hydrolase [Paenibacillus hunanensis]GGJ23770.1 gamma-glutamyltransferase [Paenibacillus hunanensis]